MVVETLIILKTIIKALLSLLKFIYGTFVRMNSYETSELA